jgi:glycosyltransferase involved in cell wall biosynthesis
MYRKDVIQEDADFDNLKEDTNHKPISNNLISLTNPKISIIIPVLQEEKILKHTLLNYTNELRKKYNFEVIVSDGGSTDKSIEISELYADVVIQSNGIKQNISQGRNAGAKIARGDILIFINADTLPKDIYFFFSFIEKWIKGETKYTNSDALACKVTVDPQIILLKDRIFYFIHNCYVRLLNALGIGMGRGECQIVKRDMFFLVGGYNETIVAGEDFDFYRRISKSGNVSFVKEIIVCESPRRFRKYGYLKIILQWTLNAISVLLKGKSISEDWEPVR